MNRTTFDNENNPYRISVVGKKSTKHGKYESNSISKTNSLIYITNIYEK